MDINYNISSNNLHIVDSYKIKSIDTMYKIIDFIKTQNPTNEIFKLRSYSSLINEWSSHNLLYTLHIFRSHTKDVDLEIPQKWFYKVGYLCLSYWYRVFY